MILQIIPDLYLFHKKICSIQMPVMEIWKMIISIRLQLTWLWMWFSGRHLLICQVTECSPVSMLSALCEVW